jgi:hypothetical protein
MTTSNRKGIILLLLFTVVCLPALTACGKSASENHSTEAIDADMRVIASNNHETEVTVELTIDTFPSPTHIILTGDDRLDATADGHTERLDRDGNHYEATFDTAEGGTEFRILFKREVDDDARNSTVILPEPFDISEPLNDALITGAGPVSVSWDPAGNAPHMWLQAYADCRSSSSGTVPLTGPRISLDDASGSTAETMADLLGVNDLSSYDQGCTCTVRIRRENDGHLDHRFHDGDIIAQQRREVSFRYQP